MAYLIGFLFYIDFPSFPFLLSFSFVITPQLSNESKYFGLFISAISQNTRPLSTELNIVFYSNKTAITYAP